MHFRSIPTKYTMTGDTNIAIPPRVSAKATPCPLITVGKISGPY